LANRDAGSAPDGGPTSPLPVDVERAYRALAGRALALAAAERELPPERRQALAALLDSEPPA